MKINWEVQYIQDINVSNFVAVRKNLEKINLIIFVISLILHFSCKSESVDFTLGFVAIDFNNEKFSPLFSMYTRE